MTTIEKLENLKDEIRRAYNVLGEQGEMQNEIDINEWERTIISPLQAKALRIFNRQLAFEYNK